ncbi:uncharacterized protein [Mytilus edulis]|uniref:uncharacterized protein n=1 Tax=Mytilus edulis TaxID=6550 RepID=UPI0039F0AD50
MKETSVGLHDGMKEAAVHYVLEKLDLEHLFEGPKCDRKRKPYIPSVQGWHNECKFGVFRLPDVENMMSCHLTEFCTGIKCCGVIPVFGLTLEPFLIIDPCEYVIFYGINKINRSLSLFDYEWGKKIQLSLANNVIKIEFSIRKPPGQKIYIIDLSIMACLIDGENCVPDIKILDSTQFRQIVCDLDVTFNLKNFSLNNWIQQIGSNDVSGKLSTSQVRLLLQQLGLDKHISFPGCKRADSKYLPTVKGWKSDCTHLSSAGLVELPKYLSCSLSASCTAVDCCMDFNLLNLTLNFHMSVDTCGFIIKGAIEKLDFELPFSNYIWGDFREVRLREVIRIIYKIELLSDQNLIIWDLQFSICLEPDVCHPVENVLKSQLIPIPLCEMKMEFNSGNVSLIRWMEDKGLEIGQSLTTALGNELLNSFGLTNYMNDEQCNRFEGVYAGAVNGWNLKDCPVNMTLPRIHSSITCHLSELCTGIKCCIEVGKIKKTFNVFIILDYCLMQLSVGIERKSFEISLLQYKWGKFSVYDLAGENMFLLSLNISVCLEVEGSCLIHVPIFKNTKLPKYQCDWSKNRNSKGFSLEKFKLENDMSGSVKGLVLTRLLEELGIAKYLNEEQCNRLTSPFLLANSIGWNDECKRLQRNTLPKLRGPISCYLNEACTHVDCCIFVAQINRTISLFLDIDSCNYQMSVGIETLLFRQSLLQYEFGKTDMFRMGDVVVLKYSIEDMKGERMFLLNMDLSVCFETEGSCILKLPLLRDVLIPKPVCSLDQGFSKHDFSLQNFSQNVVQKKMSLPKFAVDIFLEQLEITKFLESVSCNRKISPYFPDENGWNNGCKYQLGLPVLNDPVTCHITKACSQIECCLEVKPLQRSFHAYIFLDACSNRIKLGIENYNLDTVYFDFKFGAIHRVSLGNMLIMDYSIHNFLGEKKYLINLNISECLEADQCSVITILDDTFLPYSICDWNKTMSDFSLKKFLKQNKLPQFVQQLPATNILQVLEQSGVREYMQSTQCSTHDQIYKPSRNGWTNGCSSASGSLPFLYGPVLCMISSDCRTIDCCLNVPLIKRSFHLVMFIDLCARKMTLQIEKLKMELSLWDAKLKHFLRMCKIENDKWQNRYHMPYNPDIPISARGPLGPRGDIGRG